MNKLESDIIQALEAINMVFRASLGGSAESFGISQTQANIIIMVASGLTKISGLARKLGVTDATVSDSVKSLKRKELLTSVENTRDTRSKILALTEKGREIAKELSNYSENIRAQISEMHMSEKSVLLESLQNLSAKITASFSA